MYVTFVMGLCTLSTVAAIFILYLHHHVAKRCVPPAAQKIFFRYLATVLCMRSSVPKGDHTITDDHQWADKVRTEQPRNVPNGGENVKQDQTAFHNPQMEDILYYLRFMSNRMKKRDLASETQEQWKALARVMDRLFFWMCLLGFAIACMAIFGPAIWGKRIQLHTS